jgi:MinD superfamily P-loop ATPase
MAAVINRAGLGERSIYDYCRSADIPILAEIPFDRRIAEAYSHGRIVAAALPELNSLFAGLVPRLRELARAAAVREATLHA